ncbi:hypothetical protein [Alteribacter natronophilus]|uniref:hypothetical protein n=1 Tax=Alteribacter natronophilus TaxID=2583810 RepID=UPI00110DEA6C|nr:hypothetical protein [Alteribacter natronophilus]TMW71247.1 hypothetical protein FGB90_14960 [Alteribacter natronophilus]
MNAGRSKLMMSAGTVLCTLGVFLPWTGDASIYSILAAGEKSIFALLLLFALVYPLFSVFHSPEKTTVTLVAIPMILCTAAALIMFMNTAANEGLAALQYGFYVFTLGLVFALAGSQYLKDELDERGNSESAA